MANSCTGETKWHNRRQVRLLQKGFFAQGSQYFTNVAWVSAEHQSLPLLCSVCYTHCEEMRFIGAKRVPDTFRNTEAPVFVSSKEENGNGMANRHQVSLIYIIQH